MTLPKEHPIQFESVRVKDIYPFACRAAEQVEARTILPISRQRALAWSKNPYADPDDVALHVAYHQGQCVGYQGVMPGRLKVDGAVHKVLWTSTLFVVPKFRQYQVALQLNKRAISASDDFLAVGPSVEAQTFLRLLRWRPMRPAVVAELRFHAGAMNRLDRLVYPLKKSVCRRILMSSTARLLAGLRWREVSRFSAEDVGRFVDDSETGYQRGLDVINWMIQYPWIVERGQQPDDSANYRFSNVRDVFRYIPVLLYRTEDRAPDGFVVFSVSKKNSRTTLKVLDFGPSNPAMCERIAGLALHLAITWSADVVELPTPVGSALTGFSWASWLIRARELPCYGWAHDADSPLSKVATQLGMGHADGDLAFT